MSAVTSSYLSFDASTDKLTFSSAPSATRQGNGERVLIIGGGVTGLTTAWALLDAGYAVTVISEQWAPAVPRITSQIAGALWEYPPAVCGRHTDLISLAYSKEWSLSSYRVFAELASKFPDSGIKMRFANFFFNRPVEDIPEEMAKMLEIQLTDIAGFKRDAELIKEHKVNQEANVVDSYRHLAPFIDTDAYMLWLRDIVAAKGAKLMTGKVPGLLLAQEEVLLKEYNARVLVNATGLNAIEAANDTTSYPLRGALIRVVNDGTRFPKVTEALVVPYDETDEARKEDGEIVFIVPRNDNILILGGLVQHTWDLNLTLDSPEIKRMRTRCNNFVPGLENAEYDPEAAIVQGLRPFRGTNVRVERELATRPDGSSSKMIHSYGHGGAGFTLSFGCAKDVLRLVGEVEADVVAKDMKERLEESLPLQEMAGM